MENLPNKASSALQPKKTSEALQKVYELQCSRLQNEYEQRDRDFTLYLTVNSGLVAALGFLVKDPLRFGSPLVFSAVLLLFAVIGFCFARALLKSVRSFEYWQSLLNVALYRIERVLLTESSLGFYTQVVWRHRQSRDHLTKKERQDTEKERQEFDGVADPPLLLKAELLDARSMVANVLVIIWVVIFVAGAVVFASVVFPGLLGSAVQEWWTALPR